MSIQNDVNELKHIEIELKRLRVQVKKLNSRKKDLNDKIAEFLKSKDQVGVKYQGKAIILNNKTKREYKSQKDKHSDGVRVLREYGISDPKKVLDEIIESMKGNKIETSNIKIQNLQK